MDKPCAQCDLLSAIEQLWNWVGEQKDSQKMWIDETCQCQGCITMRLKRETYHGVMQKMRTLFSGLIDFQEIGENTDE